MHPGKYQITIEDEIIIAVQNSILENLKRIHNSLVIINYDVGTSKLVEIFYREEYKPRVVTWQLSDEFIMDIFMSKDKIKIHTSYFISGHDIKVNLSHPDSITIATKIAKLYFDYCREKRDGNKMRITQSRKRIKQVMKNLVKKFK